MRKTLSALPLILLAWPAVAQTAGKSQSGEAPAQATTNMRVQYGVVVPGLPKSTPAVQPRPAYKPNPLGARSGGTGD